MAGRGRPKKKKEEEISAEEVYNVLDFAKQMYNMYPGIFTPNLVNSRLKDINMNPLTATSTSVEDALADPKNNEVSLRGYSEYFSDTNMIYKRILSYLGNMLSFDYTFVCTNAEEKDYQSKAFKKEEKVLIDFLDKFDVKKELKKVMRQLVKQEVFYSFFRDDGNKYILQELPADYCEITGRGDETGLLFDFDMQWFIANAGVDINMYPKVFKKYWKRVMDNKDNGYVPSKPISSRNGEYIYKVQTSPDDGAWAWKMNPEQIGLVPMLSPMFPDLANAGTIRTLQKDKYIISASRLLIGIIPMLKDNKSGSVKDMLALNPETAGKFAGLIRQALPSSIDFGVTPFEDVKSYDFSGDTTNIQEDYNKNVGATSGINTRLIFSLDRQNALETQSSISVDEYLMTYIYPHFNDFMNFYINKKTNKFRFEIFFEGTEFSVNRETRLNNAKTLAELGMVDLQMFSSALGISPQNFMRRLQYTKSKDFVDGLTPILMASQMSSDDAGRPTKATNDLKDSGIITKENGSNIGKE